LRVNQCVVEGLSFEFTRMYIDFDRNMFFLLCPGSAAPWRRATPAHCCWHNTGRGTGGGPCSRKSCLALLCLMRRLSRPLTLVPFFLQFSIACATQLFSLATGALLRHITVSGFAVRALEWCGRHTVSRAVCLCWCLHNRWHGYVDTLDRMGTLALSVSHLAG
jgi:hypothetical protein